MSDYGRQLDVTHNKNIESDVVRWAKRAEAEQYMRNALPENRRVSVARRSTTANFFRFIGKSINSFALYEWLKFDHPAHTVSIARSKPVTAGSSIGKSFRKDSE